MENTSPTPPLPEPKANSKLVQRIVGVFILFFIAGISLFYGTKALGINPLVNNLAGFWDGWFPIVDDPDTEIKIGLGYYKAWDGNNRPPFCDEELREVQNLQGNIKALENKLKAEESQRAKKANELTGIQKSINDANQQKAGIQKQISDKTKQLQDPNLSPNQKKQIQSEIQSLQRSLEPLDKKVQELQKNADAIRKELEKLDSDIMRDKQQLNKLKKDLKIAMDALQKCLKEHEDGN